MSYQALLLAFDYACGLPLPDQANFAEFLSFHMEQNFVSLRSMEQIITAHKKHLPDIK